MLKNFFVIQAPPLSFTKRDIYTPFSSFSSMGQFIKAISDTFFLSNKFRFDNFLYFCTEYKQRSYVITFDGEKMRYLGPSLFSAAHLLLRVQAHIDNPNTKKGKLTPGLSVYQESFDLILEKHSKDNWIQFIPANVSDITNLELSSKNIFIYGIANLLKITDIKKVYCGKLDIDEQVILTNYVLDQGEYN